MKANIVLAFLVFALAFALVPLSSFAVDVPTLYRVDSKSTINSYVSTGRTTGPNLIYYNGRLMANFGGLGIDTGGDDKTYMSEYTGSWGAKWEILSGMAHNGWEFPMVVWQSGSTNYIIGMALDNARPYGTNCKSLLVYSTDGGHSWSSGGYLTNGAYSYCFSRLVTSDGAIIFTGWASGGSIYTYVCPSGSNPLVSTSYQKGANVPVSGDEPSIVELAPQGSGHLLMAFRQGSGVGWATSSNYGTTWGNIHTLLSSPSAPQSLVRLSWNPDRIMVAWNNNPASGQRTPLSLAISEDSGVSWSNPFDIATKSSEGGYPCYPRLVMCQQNIAVGYWVTDVTGDGGTGTGELTRCAILVPVGGSTYSVTMTGHCNNRSADVNVKIYLDGVDTGHLTPYTIPNLSGTHTIQVEDADVHGHFFQYWDNPPLFALFQLSDSLTVTGESTHTAYYDTETNVIPELWPYMVLFAVGAVSLVAALSVTRWRLFSKGRRRRHK